MRRKRGGAAGWCEQNGIGPGDKIEAKLVDEWCRVRVTALGESAILIRRKGAGEYAFGEPTKLRALMADPPVEYDVPPEATASSEEAFEGRKEAPDA